MGGGIFLFLLFHSTTGDTIVRIYRKTNWRIFSPDQTRRFADRDFRGFIAAQLKEFKCLPHAYTDAIFLSLENICFKYCRSYKLLLNTPVAVYLPIIIHFDQKKFTSFIIAFACQLAFRDVAIVILSDCKKIAHVSLQSDNKYKETVNVIVSPVCHSNFDIATSSYHCIRFTAPFLYFPENSILLLQDINFFMA